MRLRNIPGAGEVIDNSPYCIKEPVELKGKWHDFLGNNNPIHIEVGMGKGRFLMDLARLHPEINYIGIERYTSVLLRAVQKMQEDELPNVHFLCIDAATLPDIFDRNEDLFTFSLEEIESSDKWHLDASTRDLHHDAAMNEGNIMTEYEEKFSAVGNPICKLIASR